jgi:hypothetical protein
MGVVMCCSFMRFYLAVQKPADTALLRAQWIQQLAGSLKAMLGTKLGCFLWALRSVLPLQGSGIAPNSWPGQIPTHIKTPSIRFYQILSPSSPSPDAVGETWRNTNFAWVWEDDRANSINKRQQASQKSVQNAMLVFLFYAHSANRLPSSSRMPPTEALCRNKLRDPCNDPCNMGR